MSMQLPKVPQGNGDHPFPMIVLSAKEMAASTGFYSKVFEWQGYPISSTLTSVAIPSGPSVTLRSDLPDGFPTMIPFLFASDLPATLQKVEAAGGSIETEPWNAPMAGQLARFKDPSGTIYGLINSIPPGPMTHVPMPFGANPKPPANTICSMEMYAASGEAAARFFGDLFGWGTLETMPGYMAFDPGAGIGGVFQSHTPTMPAVPYIYVTDVKAKLADIAAAGGTPTSDAMDMPGMGCFGYFTDPSGAHMGLIGP